MKYDVAMHLLANGIIKEEQYELVSKILSGVRISQDDLEAAIDHNHDSSYGFYGVIGKSNYTNELEITHLKDKFVLDYEVGGMKFEISKDKQGQVELHVRRANYTGRLRDNVTGYYIIDKFDDEDNITIRYYDGEAYSLAKRLDNSSEYLEVENFEKVGLLPDEEVVVDTDVLDFASSIMAPYTKGVGTFEEVVDEKLHPGKQKILNK